MSSFYMHLIINKTLNYEVARVNIIGKMFIFMHHFSFLCWVKVCSGRLDIFFFHLGAK